MPFLCGAYATRTLIGCIVCLYSTRATAVAINRYLPTTDCGRQDIKSAATNAERGGCEKETWEKSATAKRRAPLLYMR